MKKRIPRAVLIGAVPVALSVTAAVSAAYGYYLRSVHGFYPTAAVRGPPSPSPELRPRYVARHGGAYCSCDPDRLETGTPACILTPPPDM
jgi:hypothetical protein